MKKNIWIMLIAFSALCAACVQQPLANSPVSTEEIVLGLKDFEATVDTKATAVTSIPSSLYWGASTGSLGSETAKWSAASSSVSTNSISTGKYQTLSPTTYNYFVANQTFSVSTSCTMTVANNNTDVICGKVSSSSTTPSVTLNHIFARTGSFTLNTQTGYSLSNVSWSIVSKGSVTGTAGTYNLSSDTWTSRSAALASTAVTSSSDLYLLPGEYTITCNYTLTKGDWTNTFSKTADITLVKGKVNNVTATAIGGNASEIVIGLSLTAWGSNGIDATLQ